MTREAAIQYAEEKYKKGLYRLEMGYLNRGLYQVTAREVDFLRAAIAALREQDSNANQHVSNTSNALESFNQKTEADTVKGCKLCNSARFDIAAQTRDPDDMYVFSSDPVIGAMFCPLCGRRLEEV